MGGLVLNPVSAFKAVFCLLRCGHFLYTAKKIVSALTVILFVCTVGFCVFGDKKRMKRLAAKVKAVMK